LLTTFEVRRRLRKAIERDFPKLAVLSYQELPPDLNIQTIARISWP
jgi:type III secretion protein V